MFTTIMVVIFFALGFGAGRIHNVKNFEARVAEEVAKGFDKVKTKL